MMTAMLLMQKLDTLLLVIIMLSAIVIYLHDKELSLPCRLLVIGLGFGCFAQATWLQSYWWPNASAGYPWAGLVRDFCVAGIGVLRTVTVLRRLYAERSDPQNAARMNG